MFVARSETRLPIQVTSSTGRASTPARPDLYLADPGTYTGNRASDSDLAINSGEQVAQHNTVISYNTDAAPSSVLASLEHTDCQSRGLVPSVEAGNIVNPQLDLVTSGQKAQSRPSPPSIDDPELRAILRSLPTKQDLAILLNRGDLEAVAQHLEVALQRDIRGKGTVGHCRDQGFQSRT